MPGAELRAAIRQVYAVFAAIPCPRKLDASPLRDADAILRALTSAPLPNLPDAALAPYSRWAITTVGMPQDFRHFLPRILELAATDPDWTGAEPPVIADRILRAGWPDWPADERKPVADLFSAAFAETLAREAGGAFGPEDWLCGMATVALDLAAPLAGWRANRSGEAALDLADFVFTQANSLRQSRQTTQGHWEAVAPAAQAQVGAWLSAQETAIQLRSALALPPPGGGWEIAQALAILDSIS
jgi:hypothetical protein